MLSRSDGYISLLGEIKIQWGSFSQVGYQGTKYISFPTYFLSVFAVIITPTKPIVYPGDNGTFHALDVTTSGFTAQYSGDNNPAPGGYWVAIGR